MRSSSRIARLGGCLAVLACVLFAARPAYSQTQATTGVIEGTVTDPSGAAVAGAQVTITNTGTGYERQVTADSSGFYRAVLLPLGSYSVAIEKSGFAKTLVQNVQVTMGASTPVDVKMKIAAAGTQITVTAAAPLIETTKTETSSGLGELSIQGLPSTSRNYLDYLTLTPNVHITQGPDGPEIDVNGQKGTETGFMVDGAEANSQFFGEQAGGQRPVANVSMEAVKEFQVVAEGAAPEFGHYTGAFINVVTKSGTNQVHGSLFHLQEFGGLTGQLADGTSQKNFSREDFGGSIGGPIKKNKLFYFGTFEGVFTRFKKDNTLLHCCTVTDPSTGIASFAAPAVPGAQVVNLGQFMQTNFGSAEAGPIPHTNDLQAVLGKIDWVPNSNHTVTIRDYFARSIQENGTFDVSTFGASANGTEKDYNNRLIGSWAWVLSPSLLNEFRFQFARENRPRQEDSFLLPDTTIGPCTQRLDFEPPTIFPGCLGRNFRFGQPFFHPSFVVDKQFQITDNFSIVHGQHSIKFGFDTLNNVENNFFQGFARGYWEFDTVEGFLNYVNFGPTFVECSPSTGFPKGSTSTNGSCPTGANIIGPLLLFLQFAPEPGLTLAQASINNFNQFESGLFIQDKWQALPGLTITYGLRWDNYNQRGPALPPSQTRIGQFLNVPGFPSNGLVPGYHKAFQPRLGIAWDPRDNGKTVIRLNAGVFFGGLPAIIVANGTANNGSIASTVFAASSLNAFGLPPPVYPQCATGTFTPPVCPAPTSPFFDPQVVLFGNNFVYPRTYEGSIGFEQELSRGWKVSASFNYALATHQNRTELFNEPPFSGTGPDGRALYQGDGGLGPFSGCSSNLAGLGLPASPENPNCFGAGIATFSNVIRSDGRSLYRGFTVKVDHQFTRGFLLSGYYTYSQTYDDGTSERDQFTDPFSDPVRLAPEYGPSPQDQRHNFGFYSVWKLPWHITWSNTMYAHSARPTSLLCNFDANGDSSANGDRVFTDGKGNYSCGPGGTGRKILVNGQLVTLVPTLVNGHDVGRDSARFPDVGFDWNMRIQRDWNFGDRYKLEPSVEIFNLTDSSNFLFPACSELQSCLQGTILQIPGESRRAQLGLRFEW
jgi:Carboxypeptidase regulatory-like domain/TonB dependent receptor-like, beta-barrel